MTRAAGLLLLTITTVTAQPKFEDYPVIEVFRGTPAAPILATAEQRTYRTRIRNGVAAGAGPNFAGHYFVISFGCGSNCATMAMVDARTGEVHGPPMSRRPNELHVPLDAMGPMEIDFHRQSSLMVLRNACMAGRTECGVYYFNWKNGRFDLVKRILANISIG